MSDFPDDLVTGRKYLTEEQYKSDDNLAARQSIYEYQTPFVDLRNSTLDLAGLQGDERVVDVGCGNGTYLEVLRVRGHRGPLVGLDLSPGMLTAAAGRSTGAAFACVDAQQIPFCDDAFDCVLAMHMMYHVPDRSHAIGELRRVLQPDGVALVVTNSTEHLRELDELVFTAAADLLGAPDPSFGRTYLAFKMETGADELRAHFDHVDSHMFESELVLTDVEPVRTYVGSIRAFVADLSDDMTPVLDLVSERVAAVIAKDGAFRVRTSSRLLHLPLTPPQIPNLRHGPRSSPPT